MDLAELLRKARKSKLTSRELSYVYSISALCSKVLLAVHKANRYYPEKMKKPYVGIKKARGKDANARYDLNS